MVKISFMIKIVIAMVGGIAISVGINYFLFKETMVIPSIIGVISFAVAYKLLNRKKENQ